jgi:glycosyltransferase involved in cell wall biosynthesis
MSSQRPHILLMGQTPPPWHGQAVATQILFDHDWQDYEVHRLRMEFSEEMQEVGRFQWKKIGHLFRLIAKSREILKEHPGCVLFYPPASAKWIPFLRDVIFLSCVRHLAGSTVFIFHASGLPVFVGSGLIRKFLGNLIYRNAEVSLEVAQEAVTPHESFAAKSWQWCPCAIEIPEIARVYHPEDSPLNVLYVGSLQEGKGVIEILRTAALLRNQGRERDFRFRIVGKWFSKEFEEDLRHLNAELQTEKMIEFAGQLTGDEKWRAYANADVFFFPTHYASEATPIVLMEALGVGLPIVSTLWAGIPAMLDGCKTARLLPIRSPEQYASALAELFLKKDGSIEADQTSRAFYRAHFQPASFINRVGMAFVAASNARRVSNSESISKRDTLQYRSDSDRHNVPEAIESRKIQITAYLADQNPGYDRSFGISRMTHVVLNALQAGGVVAINAIASRTSQKAPDCVDSTYVLPWGTRRKWIRLLTDHLHPLFNRRGRTSDLFYFPKGYLPLLGGFCRPSVVTIHDTIIQYDEDHYPQWRSRWEYAYWAMMLKHTLRNADRILTVSESSKRQIEEFMTRHQIPKNNIAVTYEPCLYESIPQPAGVTKENYVIHLASCEPHKQTANLIRWWQEAETSGRELPMLHLIGTVPPEAEGLLSSSHSIVKRPFLEDDALQAAYLEARALILPSEIEGFGLPALEAYYLGTPVCYVKGTSVEEILGVATSKGGFGLDTPESLFSALDEIMRMNTDEIRQIGLKLRDCYASRKVAERMTVVFESVRHCQDLAGVAVNP